MRECADASYLHALPTWPARRCTTAAPTGHLTTWDCDPHHRFWPGLRWDEGAPTLRPAA